MSQVADVATSKPIYSTQYPFYFIKEGDASGARYKDLSDAGQISYDCFTNPTRAHDEYHKTLNTLYERVNKKLRSNNQPELMNVYDDYVHWTEDNPQHTLRNARDRKSVV